MHHQRRPPRELRVMSRITAPSMVRSRLSCRLARLNCFGMGIALMLDQRYLAHPHLGLAQGNAMPLGQLHQPLAGAMHQLGVALARCS